MPLTLTSRDKAYVRAVAHGGAHDMYRGYRGTVNTNSGKFMRGRDHDRYALIHLGQKPKAQIAKSWHDANNGQLQDIDHPFNSQFKNSHNLDMFGFPKDTAAITKDHSKRYGDNVFLESTHLTVRVSMPHARYNADENTFGRLVVFRTKERQSHIPEDSLDHANPHYELFLESDRHEIGLNGFVKHDDAEHYVDRTNHANLTAGHIQNLLVNKKRYVVMKDCNFNLGKDFGALAMQTKLHWDWNDQMNDIPHTRSDITAAQDGDAPNKNYEWYILVLASDPNGETANQLLDVDILGTTKAKTMD